MGPDSATPIDNTPAAGDATDNFVVPVHVERHHAPVVTNHAVDTDFAPTNRRPSTVAFSGPGAAAIGSLHDDPPPAQPPRPAAALDTPFNGALQPASDALSSNAMSQGSLLEDAPVTSPSYDIPPEPNKPFYRRRTLALSFLVFGIVMAGLLGFRLEANKSKVQNSSLNTPSSSIQQQQIPLTTLDKQIGVTSAASGRITVNGSLILAPTIQPSDPVSGQLFYSQTANQLQYYDGTGFVGLQGGGNVTNNVTNVYNTTTSGGNVTNVTNNINQGALTGNGTAGTLAMFDSTGKALTDSLLSQTSTTIATTADTLQGSNTQGLSILTANTPGASGALTLQSGNSATDSSGTVTLDTGSGVVNGMAVFTAGFEDGVDQCYGGPWGPATAQSNVMAHSGTYSLALTSTGNWTSTFCDLGISVIPGHEYRMSAWVRAGTHASSGAIAVAYGSPQTNFTDSVGSWTEVSNTLVIPAGVTSVQPLILFAEGSNATHYVDDVSITDLNTFTGLTVNVGTTNAQAITIGNGNQVGDTIITGGTTGVKLNDSIGDVSIDSGTDATITANNVILSGAGGTGNGVIVKPQSDSTTAFQVQSADGSTTLLNVDTTGSAISLGKGAGSSIGSTYVGTNVGSAIGSGVLVGYKFSTTAAGMLGSLSVNIGLGNTTAPNNQYQLAIYADNSGTPGALLGSTAIGSITSTGWNSLSLTTPVNVSANTSYWLSFWDNGNETITYSTGYPSATAAGVASTWGNGTMPSTWPIGGSTTNGSLYSIYATYISSTPALTINSSGLLTQSGPALFQDPTDSTTALQVENSLGSILLTVDTADMTIAVNGALSVAGNITINGHVVTGGSTPTIVTGAAACTSPPTPTITGNDTSGTISVTTGASGCASGIIASISFAGAFGAAPHVTLTPTTAGTQTLGQYIDGSTISATGFKIGTANTPAINTTYSWSYWVAQ
jgi:hypothetical protein